MQLEFVAVRETQASRIFPKKRLALRVFLVLFEQPQSPTPGRGGGPTPSG